MKATEIIQPIPLIAPIAADGIKNTLPDSATGTNNASIEEGFPGITMKAPKDGGLPPWGQDFNGLFYTLSTLNVSLQNGGIITFDEAVSDKIGGYPQEAILDYVDNNGNYYKVQSLIDDNTNNFVANPQLIDNINWKYLNIVSQSDKNFLNNSQISNCLLSVVGGNITTDNYTGVSYVNKDCSVSGNVASGFGAAAYILLNKVFTDSVNFTFEIPFKLNAVTGRQYIAQINNEANGFGVKDGVLFLTYDGAEEDGAIQLQPNIDYTIKLERISAQKAYVLSLKTTGSYTEHLRVVSASGFYAGKSVFLGGGSENYLNGTINLAGVTIKEGSTNYWTVSSTASFQTVTVQGTFNALMPDGLNADKTLNNENATLTIDKELLYSPSNGTKTVLVKNDGEVMIRPDYTVSDVEPADQPQGGVWYNTGSNVLAEQTIIYPNIQLINPSGGAAPAISNGVLNITIDGQYADLPGTVTLGDNWDISMVLTGEPTQDGGFILGDVVSNSGTVMPSGIAIQYNDGNITAYFRREDVQVVEKETIISTAYLVAKDSGSTTGYVAVAGEADAFVAENTPVYSDQTMETLLENAAADTWIYSGYSFDNIQTTTGYVKEEGAGQFVAPNVQVYTDANCTTPQATASGIDYKFTGDTAASLIGTLTTAYSNTIALSYNGTQYVLGSQTLTSSDPIKSNSNITLGGISSDSASVLTGINLTTSTFSFWEWNGSSIDTPSYQAFVGAKIGEITDNGTSIVNTSLDAPLVLAKAADVANRDLSNLTRAGETHFLNKTQLTNCVLEIPQRVNLVDNGTNIIIKAGTIGIQPNGFEADGTTPKFDYITVTADITLENNQTTTLMLGLNGAQNVYRTPIDRCFSGPTAPASPVNLSVWYDTSTNLVKRYVNSAWEVANYTLPLGILNYTASGTPGSIQQVFNGFGYIGSSLWIDKGVRMLIPNYRNEDGTLKNQDFTTEKIYLTTYDSDYTRINAKLVYARNVIAIYSSMTYDSAKNIMINAGNELSGIKFSDTGNTVENGVIQSINIPQTVSLEHNLVSLAHIQDLDGNWTYKNSVLCNQQMTTVLAEETDLNFDLSSYLPDDDNRYEIIVNGYIFVGPTGGSSLAVSCRNSQGFAANICGSRTLGTQSSITSAGLSTGSCLMVVEADRQLKIRYYATGSNGQLRSINIVGYRKVR